MNCIQDVWNVGLELVGAVDTCGNWFVGSRSIEDGGGVQIETGD